MLHHRGTERTLICFTYLLLPSLCLCDFVVSLVSSLERPFGCHLSTWRVLSLHFIDLQLPLLTAGISSPGLARLGIHDGTGRQVFSGAGCQTSGLCARPVY